MLLRVPFLNCAARSRSRANRVRSTDCLDRLPNLAQSMRFFARKRMERSALLEKTYEAYQRTRNGRDSMLEGAVSCDCQASRLSMPKIERKMTKKSHFVNALAIITYGLCLSVSSFPLPIV